MSGEKQIDPYPPIYLKNKVSISINNRKSVKLKIKTYINFIEMQHLLVYQKPFLISDIMMCHITLYESTMQENLNACSEGKRHSHYSSLKI